MSPMSWMVVAFGTLWVIFGLFFYSVVWGYIAATWKAAEEGESWDEGL